MKKNPLIYQIVFSFFILSFSSCINQDFDIDDEKLDKNVTLGNSINLPVGNIQKIIVSDELRKVYDELKSGDDGVLYIEYKGEFPVEFPRMDFPIEEDETHREITNISGEIPLTGAGGSRELIKSTMEYKLTVPELEEIKVDAKKIVFNSLDLNVGFRLTGISLDAEEGAEVIVTLTFSEHYGIEGSSTVTYTIPFAELNKESENSFYYPSEKVQVSSYTFDPDKDGELTYTLALNTGSATRLTASDPHFSLVLKPENPKPDISYLECSLKGTKEFDGGVDGFGDLEKSFSPGDVLKFNNPSLSLNLTTKLGTDFKLGLDLSKTIEGDEKIVASLDDDKLLSFEKPEFGFPKTETYSLTPENLVNFDDIISTPFPTELDYVVKLSFDDDNAKLSPEQLDLSADYTFKIPFDFKEIDLSLKDTITNLFSEDIYDQVFSHTKKSVSIQADVVDVSIGDGGIGLQISAAILDANFNEIIDFGDVLKENKTLSIAIEGDDLEKMKDARHLGFVFRLSGQGAIKESDYIEIKGVRIVSESGIHYEF